MKRLIIIFTLLLTATTLRAQQTENNDCESVIYLDSRKENTISSSNGKLSLMLNGTRFEIGNKEEQKTESTNIKKIKTNKNSSSVYFGLFGIGSPRFNHFSAWEIGSNIFTGLSYDGYTKEEANALTFSSRKAVCVTMNVGSLNVPLTKNRSLVASLAFGFTWENYTIAGNYTMEYREGMMRPLAIDANLKKSKMVASYFHVPLTLDWNIKEGFFISAGVNLDILMGSHLKYKFPKTKIKDEITLNPVQVGFTARIGWKRIYVFTNYAFNEAFKAGTGPKANRFSVGMGIGF